MSTSKEEALREKEKGNASFGKKQYSDALVYYSNAIDLDPGNAMLYSNRSAAAVHLKNYELAISDAKLLTKLLPAFAKGWGRLGTALQASGRYEEAAPAYEQGFKLDSTLTDYQKNATACRSQASQGRGIAGADTRNQFYAEKHKKQGLEQFQKGNYVSAIRYFSQALESDPRNHLHYSNRSAARLKLADSPITPLKEVPLVLEQALEDAVKCINLSPSFAKGFARKGAALHGLKRYTASKEAYEAGLELDPTSQHCTEGLSKVVAVIDDIKKENDKWEKKKEENKKNDELLKENPDMCPIPDLKIPSVYCHKCGKEGHFPSNCTEKVLLGVQGGGYSHSYSTCYYCGEMGHTKAECPQRRGGGGGGRGGGGNRTGGGRKRELKEVVLGDEDDDDCSLDDLPENFNTCYTCGSSDHSSEDCPMKGLSRQDAKHQKNWHDAYVYKKK